jgi:hypothetical protein
MKNVPEDYRIEDLLDVQTIVSVRFCYVTVLMLISTSTPELLDRVSPEQESRRAQTLELRRSSSASAYIRRIKAARVVESGEAEPDMSDIMRDLRIKARDNGRLPVPVCFILSKAKLTNLRLTELSFDML